MTAVSSETNANADATAPPPPPHDLGAGDVVGGRYRIEGVIGVGAMGVVFSARQLDLDRRVALKVLAIDPRAVGTDDRAKDAAAESDSHDARARFGREARVLSKLTSSNVCRLLDVGNLESGAPFMVMELLEGQDLSKLLKSRGPIPIAMTLTLALQACEALSEAHGLGIIHRDVKPANMFLATTAGGRSELKLLDFGISKVRAPAMDNAARAAADSSGSRENSSAKERSLTRAAQLLGSPLYMSPEQLRATRDVDARTDVWSLGVVLHELLSGRPPFDGESVADVCASIMISPTPSLTKIRPEISPALAAIVARCLEKDPAKRYASVADLAACIRELPTASPPKALAPRELREHVEPPTSMSMWRRGAFPLTFAPIAITGATAWRHFDAHAAASSANGAGYAVVSPPSISPTTTTPSIVLLEPPSAITDAPSMMPVAAQPQASLSTPHHQRSTQPNAAKTTTEPDLGY